MIRKAKLTDKENIFKIYQEAQIYIKQYNSPQWQDGYPNVKTFNEDIKNDQIYVNVIDEKIVSVASFVTYEPTYDIIDGNWLNDDPYIAIHRIATKTDEMRKGHAIEFLKFIKEELKYENIRIDTHKLNKPMINFLIKNGFIYCGIIKIHQKYDNERLAYHKIYK